jgi:hypothetical protein
MTGRRALLGLLVALCLGFPSPDARASHYRLPASGIFTGAETKALSAQGVKTTKKLLDRAAKAAPRRKLASASGISFGRLTELAALCDLLRVEGLGPSIARLLQASGVRHSGALRHQKASGLLKKMAAANAKHGIMEVLPKVETLAVWIREAARLPKRLEGVR